VVTVRGLRQLTLAGPEVTNALGAVTIDGAGQTTRGTGTFLHYLVVSSSRQVAIRDWTVLGVEDAANVTNSVVVFESCFLAGGPARPMGKFAIAASPALIANASQVHLVHSSATGGSGSQLPFAPGASAIRLTNSSVRVRGTTAHRIEGGGTPPSTYAAAI